MPLDISRMVEPLGDDRARISAIVRGDPQGFARLFNPLTKRMVSRNVHRDYEKLRQLLNEGAG